MKTIDIQAREWSDKINGNSYFSAIVTVDYAIESERQIKIPFAYGYWDYYEDAARWFAKQGFGDDEIPDVFAKEVASLEIE